MNVILLKIAMTREEFILNKAGEKVWKSVEVPIERNCKITRVQSNMFFFPSEILENALKVRLLNKDARLPGFEDPDGMLQFNQLHVHKNRSTGNEQLITQHNVPADTSMKLVLHAGGFSEVPQAYAWLAYVWIEEAGT
jgi:hypothetical protein